MISVLDARKIASASFKIQWILAAKELGDDVTAIGEYMIAAGLDNHTDGFWIIDFPNDFEWYSPKFRSILGFEDESDFPNSPNSWKKQIEKGSYDEAMRQLGEHIRTKSESPYCIDCVYNTKFGMKVHLICEGDVVKYDVDGNPLIMYGRHTVIPQNRNMTLRR